MRLADIASFAMRFRAVQWWTTAFAALLSLNPPRPAHEYAAIAQRLHWGPIPRWFKGLVKGFFDATDSVERLELLREGRLYRSQSWVTFKTAAVKLDAKPKRDLAKSARIEFTDVGTWKLPKQLQPGWLNAVFEYISQPRRFCPLRINRSCSPCSSTVRGWNSPLRSTPPAGRRRRSCATH